MTDLTEEMKAQGWREVPEYSHREDFIELGYYCINGKYINHATNMDYLPEKSDLDFDKGWLPVYRRLAPVTPDTIMISMEDADIAAKLAKYYKANKSLIADGTALDCAILEARLRAQLEGKE